MKVLITGISGFTGKWMLRHVRNLARNDIGITGLVNSSVPSGSDFTGVRIITGDLRDYNQLKERLSSCVPDAVIHLAGLNRGTLGNLFETNVIGTKNLLNALHDLNTECRILVIGSSAEYGYAGDSPISEDFPLHPLSEYGISKMAQEALCHMISRNSGIPVAVARPFNLVGPGQPASFVCGGIIHQIIQIERGEKDFLDLFEISSGRDFIDVRDATAAYWSILSHPGFEDTCTGRSFNVGSGEAYSISHVIECLEEITGETYPVNIPKNCPAVPVPTQRSDTSRIRQSTGWLPKISLQESLSDMLDAARNKIQTV